ncbi:MAG: carboxypeptidase-like regulatory domain-containing protein, partial [Bacteroidales bacterium]|nr:carboxypeptidase-like regulatory domain-containing protein [Bacteroidales bacterium]
MLFSRGHIRWKFLAFALLVLLSEQKVITQESILDSLYTFTEGTTRTADALNIISKRTGYSFTYDSRLIDPVRKTEMNFRDMTLRKILGNILGNDSLNYTVIDKYIIISRQIATSHTAPDTIKRIEVLYITGLVTDEESGEPLQFATVSLKNRGKGTITNGNGQFGLKINPESINDTLSISFLGFYQKELPVRQALDRNLKIEMKREFISIPGIIIRNQIPQDIIQKSLASISRNYGNTPAYLTGFYREGILRRSRLQTYSEAVIRIFKSPYTGSLLSDQIKVFKSRKIENVKRSDTLAVRLKAGLSTCLELDGVKNIFDFIDRSNMSQYSYRITDIVSYDDDAAYEIEFVQKEDVEDALFTGTIHINTSDFAILQAEFEINPKYISKIRDSFVSGPAHGFSTWPVSVKYFVNYRKINDRYFLNHVRGDLVFASRKKQQLFNTQFNIFFELAITGIDLENVTRFEREELAPVHSVFSRTITNYDPVFWGDQDFLRPEDNLLQALKNMKVRLQEFSGEDSR